jgi:hypothetical protein
MTGLKSVEALYSLTYEEREAIMNAAMHVPTVTIRPASLNSTYRTGGLQNLTATQIIDILGMKPSVQDDEDKVVNSWEFTVDGKPCAIWDYKGSHYVQMWSVYDPEGALPTLFKPENFQEGY